MRGDALHRGRTAKRYRAQRPPGDTLSELGASRQ